MSDKTETSSTKGLKAAAERRQKVKEFMNSKDGLGMKYREAEKKMVDLGLLEKSKKRRTTSPKSTEEIEGSKFSFVNPEKNPQKSYKLLNKPFYFRHTDSTDTPVPGVKLFVQINKRENVDETSLSKAKESLELYQAYKYHLIHTEKLSALKAREKLKELKNLENYESVAKSYLSEYHNRPKKESKK